MSRGSLREYIRTQGGRYRRGPRAQKTAILDEGCEMFGLHRKSLIRALNRAGADRAKRPGRPRRYGPALLAPLKTIWLAAEQPCAKRLKALLPAWLPFYERHYGVLDASVRQGLLAASASTLDRLLRPLRVRRKGLVGTRATARLQGQIPIRTRFNEVEGPGYIEADTVAHGGSSTAGAFLWSVTLTDIWSGWTENAAIWNKNARQLVARVAAIERQLPFDLLGFDSDNGSEFINYPLLRYFHDRASQVHFTRSRPSHKNDQAHVEQKQWTHVRQLLGYERFEDKRLVAMVDDLYRNEWRALQNFFLPTMQLLSKTREGGHLRRRHSKAATPYQRLLRSNRLGEEAKRQLREEYERLDPFQLHQAIETKLRAIFRIVHSTRKGATKTRVAA